MEKVRTRILWAVCFVIGISIFFPDRAVAVPARNEQEILRQPNGTHIIVQQFGDEWSNGVRTRDGYTLLKDQRSGYWMYAEEDSTGGIRRSNRIAGVHTPAGIRKFLRARPQRVSGADAGSAPSAPVSAAATFGSQPLLIIFADFTPSARAGSTAASLFNKFFGATGSVRDYYEKASYGNFSITPAPENDVSLGGLVNDGIVSVTLNYPHPNPSSAIDDRNRNITRDALIAANSYVDFSQFDLNGDGVLSPTELHIIIVVAGYERAYTSSPCGASVWGHRWSLAGTVSAPVLDGKVVGRTYAQFGEWHCSSGSAGHEATIGIMAHELGHDIGLPDLYDTDLTSQGIGNWSIMAGGSWNGVGFPGDSPAHFDPWCKLFEGWISPQLVSGTLVNQSILASATVPSIYQLLPGSASSGEFFLIENRQRFNYDAAIPGTGLLIWHIDANRTSNDTECYPGGPSCAAGHYKVAVVPADNLFNLDRNQNRGDAGDPWPGTSGNVNFSPSSSPNSALYSGATSSVSVTGISASAAVMIATLSGLDNGAPETTITGSPLALTNLTGANLTFTSSKANSTFACKLDGGGFAPCTSPKSYSGLTAGSHTFQVVATDQSNNTDQSPASFSWTVDTSAPDTSISGGPSGNITANAATLTWSGSDNITAAGNLVYAYRLDPIEPSFSAFGQSTTQSYSGLVAGNYTFLVKAKDQAGNEDATPASRSFTVSLPVSGTIALSFDGLVRDRVGQGEFALSPDGKLDGVFTVTLNAGSGARTVTRVHLSNNVGGIWNTQAPDIFWSLGVANGLDTALLNGANDAVNFGVGDGGSFKIFASDAGGVMYLKGVVFTVVTTFSDGTSASATIAMTPTSAPTVALTFDGLVRDRVGRGEFALSPDGRLDGVFTVTLNTGSGARTVTRVHLSNNMGGVWNTQAPDVFWSLGVANGLDTALLNGANDAVNFGVSDGGSFKIFASDADGVMYLNGVVFTVVVNFSDGTSASAKITMPKIALTFDGLVRDRVGQGEFALSPDGKLDGVFTVTLNAGSGARTVTGLHLSNNAGGVWNTQAPDIFWSLGVANGLDTALLNGTNDAVNFGVGDGGSFKVFASDTDGVMYLNGVGFTLTATFSDGSSASASVTISGASGLALGPTTGL